MIVYIFCVILRCYFVLLYLASAVEAKGVRPFTVDAANLRRRYLDMFGDPRLFVRELIQNSVEAIRRLPDNKMGDIRIATDPTDLSITIDDTGIGMKSDEAENAIGSLFRSNWPSDDQHRSVRSIGRFGIGMTSIIMASSRYEIETTPIDGSSSSRHLVQLVEQANQTTLLHQHLEQRDTYRHCEHGTRVVVYLRDDGPDATLALTLLQTEVIQNYVRLYAYLSGVRVIVDGVTVIDTNNKFTVCDAGKYLLGIDRAPENNRIDIKSDNFDFTASIESASVGVIHLFCRGIYVNKFPAQVLLGEKFIFLSGVLDANQIELRIDRNDVERSRSYFQFMQDFEKKFIAELKNISSRNWYSFAQIVSINRVAILKLFIDSNVDLEPFHQCFPFPDALDTSTIRALTSFVKHPYNYLGHAYVLYDSPQSILVTSLNKILHIVDCSTYVDTEDGRVNLDLLLLTKLLSFYNELGGKLSPLRLDLVDSFTTDAENTPEYDNLTKTLHTRASNIFGNSYGICFVKRTDSELPILIGKNSYEVEVEELSGIATYVNDAEIFVLSTLSEQIPEAAMYMKQMVEKRQKKLLGKPLVIFNTAHELINDILLRQSETTIDMILLMLFSIASCPKEQENKELHLLGITEQIMSLLEKKAG